jgi:hypothetical protein
VVTSVKSSAAHPIHPPLADTANVAKFVLISFTCVPVFAPELEKHGASSFWDRFSFLFANFGYLRGQRCVEDCTTDHDEQFLLLHTTVNCDVHRIIKQLLGNVPGLEKHGASSFWDRFSFLFANFGYLRGQRCVEGCTTDHDE